MKVVVSSSVDTEDVGRHRTLTVTATMKGMKKLSEDIVYVVHLVEVDVAVVVDVVLLHLLLVRKLLIISHGIHVTLANCSISYFHL